MKKLSEWGEADLQMLLTCLVRRVTELPNFRINGMSMVLSKVTVFRAARECVLSLAIQRCSAFFECD